MKDIMIKNEDRLQARSRSARQPVVTGNVNMQALETAWALSGRTTSVDIINWMRRLSIEFLRQSPCGHFQEFSKSSSDSITM